MMIVAFFGNEILSQFVAWVKNPSVEATVFEFFDVIIGTSEEFQNRKYFSIDIFVGDDLVIKSQFFRAFSPVAA